MHAILSISRILLETRQQDERATQQELEDLGHVIKGSETLEALVNDILFISKMQTSGFELNNSLFDVCELVEDIGQLQALRWLAKEVEVCVDLRVPEFSFDVFADALRLRQIITNLSTNAMSAAGPRRCKADPYAQEVHGRRQRDTAGRSGGAASGRRLRIVGQRARATPAVPRCLFAASDDGV